MTASNPSEAAEAEVAIAGIDGASALTPWRRLLSIPLKWRVLSALVLQNAATTLLVRRTRMPQADGGPLYLGSMAVLLSECIKFVACLLLIMRDEGFRGALRAVHDTLVTRWPDTLRMSVPAVCYGLQNALYFVALSGLSATSYQLWSQTKTLFTALFFVRLLGAVLRPRQWFALGLLTLGVAVVQLEEGRATLHGAAGKVATGMAGGGCSAAVGVAAVLTSSLLSGFANIYFEKMLKQVTKK